MALGFFLKDMDVDRYRCGYKSEREREREGKRERERESSPRLGIDTT